MAVSVDELCSFLNLAYEGPFKWSEKLNSKYNGIYIISLSDDPFAVKPKKQNFKISVSEVNHWLKKATDLTIEDKEVRNLQTIEKYLKRFWNPSENILYIGESSSPTNLVHKRVNDFYKHKVGNKGRHSGGYWLKLLDFVDELFIYTSQANNPRETEFKLLMRFIEESSKENFYNLDYIAQYLPFANLKVDFLKQHGIKNPVPKRRKT